MELLLTLVHPRRAGASVDVAVTAGPGTALGAARAAMLAAAGIADPGAVLCCDGMALPDDVPLGLPPLVNGAILTIGHPGVRAGTGAGTVTAPLEAHVVAGPDAGTTVPLPPGTWTVGRGAGSTVRVQDTVASRVHAELVVADAGTTVRDLGSTNGTTVNGVPAGIAEPTAVPDGGRIGVGDSTLVLRAPAGAPAVTLPDGRGHLLVNRAPRLPGPHPPAAVTFPEPPRARSPLRLPWTVVVLPLLLCLPVALIWHQPGLLLLGLSTPALVAVQHVADRVHGRREGTRDRGVYRAALSAAEHSLADAMRAEVSQLECDHPDLAMIAAIAGVPTDRLWERSPGRGGLVVRLGRGCVPSSVVGSPTPAVLRAAPVRLDLGETGVLGIAGPRPAALGLVRALLGQVAVLYSPRDLRIGLRGVTDTEHAEWGWLRWVPHYDPRAGGGLLLGAVDVDQAPRERSFGASGRQTVIVLDGGHRLREQVTRLLADGPSRGCFTICLDDEPAGLPVECGATLILDADRTGEPRRARLRRRDREPLDVEVDLASDRWAHRLARNLAPLQEAGPSEQGGIPVGVRLVDLLDGDATDGADLAGRWAAGPGGTSAVLGATGGGRFTVDLGRDGPHALIAGTTGSGKSELLQTLVTSLAVANRPDELSFLLVDYKGGAAFADCAELPHVGGLVTDLDEHLAGRALASLAAELRRRERLLRQVAASDLDTYLRVRASAIARGDETPPVPLPRLVVVVDEFRVLGEELPQFVAGLVRAAVVGRSLGVHLVLATQRPAGAVSADIRANVTLRIALRMTDRADSQDVLDVPDAAAIAPSTPGRAIARTGGSAPTTFQVARVSCAVRERDAVDVQVLGGTRPEAPDGRAALAAVPADGTDSPTGPPPPPGGDPAAAATDLHRIVAATRSAAARLGTPTPPPPWLPPLPDVVPLADLTPPDEEGIRLSYALADRPSLQQQEPLSWRLDGGTHLAAVGGPRSGRTSLLRALAVSASWLGGAVHVHGVDGGGGLAGVDGLPYLGTLAPAVDTEHCERLLRRLTQLLRDSEGPGSRDPAVAGAETLLLVDGWEAVTESWAGLDHGRLIDDLLRLLRRGAAAGIHVAVTGGRSLLTGPVAELAGERLVLAFPDVTDALLAGVPAGRVPRRWPPGRCIRLGGEDPDGVEAQVGVLGPDPDEPAQGRALARLAASDGVPGGGRGAPWRLRPLPAFVGAADLDAATAEDAPDAWSVPVGIGGVDVHAVYLPVPAGAGILVAGPPGSGRSTALARIAGSLRAAGQDVLELSRPPPEGQSGMLPIERLDPAVLAGHPAATVLVDEATRVAGTATETLLIEHLRRATATGGRVVVACEAGQAVTAYGGLLGEVRTSRLGLLLGGVEPGDGEAFGLRLAPRPAGPPGRGLLVHRGGITTVQVALPPEPVAGRR